jgi:hypothetical protein
MDLGSAIFGLMALACFIVPVIYLQRRSSQERKKFLKEFIQAAEQQQLSISVHDFWNHGYAIGIDTNKHKLFYLVSKEGINQKQIIDLCEAEKCSLINMNRMVNDSKVIDRLALKFSFRNSKLPEKALEFYNKEETMAVNEEFQLAEKWVAIINAHLITLASNNKISGQSANTVIAA